MSAKHFGCFGTLILRLNARLTAANDHKQRYSRRWTYASHWPQPLHKSRIAVDQAVGGTYVRFAISMRHERPLATTSIDRIGHRGDGNQCKLSASSISHIN